MVRSLHGRCNAVRTRSLRRPGRPLASAAEIRSILETLRQHDAERSRALTRIHAVSAVDAFSDAGEVPWSPRNSGSDRGLPTPMAGPTR